MWAIHARTDSPLAHSWHDSILLAFQLHECTWTLLNSTSSDSPDTRRRTSDMDRIKHPLSRRHACHSTSFRLKIYSISIFLKISYKLKARELKIENTAHAHKLKKFKNHI